MALLRNAVKIGLASGLALGLAQVLGLQPGWFAVVAAIMVLQASVGGSVKSAFARVGGTAIGAILGVALDLGVGDGGAQVALGAALTATLCQVLGLADAVRVATVTCPMVMLADAPTTVGFGVERTVETVLGACVGVAVAFLVWPTPARSTLRRLVGENMADLREILLLVAAPLRAETVDEPALEAVRERLRQRLGQSRQLLADLKSEPPAQPGDARLGTLLNLERRTHSQITACEVAFVEFSQAAGPLRDLLRPLMLRLVDAAAEVLADLAKHAVPPSVPGPLTALEAADADLRQALAENRRRKLSQPLSPEQVMEVMGGVHALLLLSQRVMSQHAALAGWNEVSALPESPGT